MADGIYLGMNGAAARAEQLDAIADNLANAETPGFKASAPAFESFLTEGTNLAQAASVGTGLDLRPGSSDPTGNPLDVYVEGSSFLGVRMADGTLAFTRDGRLRAGPDGTLLTAGLPVVDVSGAPISVPPGAVPEVLPDGRVMVGNEEIARLGQYELDRTPPPERLGPSLISGSGVPSRAGFRVGEVERGNVSALSTAVELVTAQRHFESAMQAVQTYKRLDDRANEIGRVR
jgi:flagellar basal-body rod protein FlgF